MYEKQSRNANRSSDTIASFLLKTYEILQHPQYQRIICWDKNNIGFVIQNVVLFTREILPKYFRHSNFSSFVRQLNMYDFHKVKQENDSLVFKNPLFVKGEQHNLKFIRRKAAKKINGQKRQPYSGSGRGHSSKHSALENEKYESLLKSFKKSIEAEINQTNLFYERSIQAIKDQCESNEHKQTLSGSLYSEKNYYEDDGRTLDLENEVNFEDPEQKQRLDKVNKVKKDTVITIPLELLREQEKVQESVQEGRQLNSQQRIFLNESTNSKVSQQFLNPDRVLELRDQCYKHLCSYEQWLKDFIENQRRKIKYVSNCRYQLRKCRESHEQKEPQSEAEGRQQFHEGEEVDANDAVNESQSGSQIKQEHQEGESQELSEGFSESSSKQKQQYDEGNSPKTNPVKAEQN